ncbi:hypothetical protein KAH81_09985 [bacterium]|nr:hypothetical protein [bacterium]
MCSLISLNELDENQIVGEWKGFYFSAGNVGGEWIRIPITIVFKEDKTGNVTTNEAFSDLSLLRGNFRWDVFNNSLVLAMGSVGYYANPSMVLSFKIEDNKMSFFFEKPIYLEKEV